ncbi:MAG: hypothetical protein K940chlam7_00381 [Chlamydiae bacterium]|nr:hypothetical protein [Chlamydiota bacterium]
MNVFVLQRRFVTLIEMMIVMFLIALIIGVVGYNYRGTLEEGKAFKSKAGIERLGTILNLAAAENAEILDDIESNWKGIVERSPLVQSPSALIKDGWGKEYSVTIEDGEIIVRSERYEEYIKNNPSMFKEER